MIGDTNKVQLAAMERQTSDNPPHQVATLPASRTEAQVTATRDDSDGDEDHKKDVKIVEEDGDGRAHLALVARSSTKTKQEYHHPSRGSYRNGLCASGAHAHRSFEDNSMLCRLLCTFASRLSLELSANNSCFGVELDPAERNTMAVILIDLIPLITQ
ncbi:hypothetical protein BX616_001736 [Lobosporangium transversale]|nr:hypothetical protein BX616_001736 [Lobosporangium transversale]